MGINMVRRLLRSGHQCVVHDLQPEDVQALVKGDSAEKVSSALFGGNGKKVGDRKGVA